MDYQDIYRSQYMKADDLNGRSATYTVNGCTAEDVGDDTKLVLACVTTNLVKCPELGEYVRVAGENLTGDASE